MAPAAFDGSGRPEFRLKNVPEQDYWVLSK